ncbi:MAG: hypothetical protein K2Q14_01740, partial [Gammaproteobacteria bacterium]|nr:hypothetical protein [Gammaproteobacteria bacterium]
FFAGILATLMALLGVIFIATPILLPIILTVVAGGAFVGTALILAIGNQLSTFLGMSIAVSIGDLPSEILEKPNERSALYSNLNLIKGIFRMFAAPFDTLEYQSFWGTAASLVVAKPFSDLADSIALGIKPYQNNFVPYARKLPYQPIRGIGNILLGTIKALLGPPLMLSFGLVLSIKSRSPAFLKETFKQTGAIFVGGMGQTVYGGLEIAATALRLFSILIVKPIATFLCNANPSRRVEVNASTDEISTNEQNDNLENSQDNPPTNNNNDNIPPPFLREKSTPAVSVEKLPSAPEQRTDNGYNDYLSSSPAN